LQLAIFFYGELAALFCLFKIFDFVVEGDFVGVAMPFVAMAIIAIGTFIGIE